MKEMFKRVIEFIGDFVIALIIAYITYFGVVWWLSDKATTILTGQGL